MQTLHVVLPVVLQALEKALLAFHTSKMADINKASPCAFLSLSVLLSLVFSCEGPPFPLLG